ncbi:MAG TPA: AAA family ATPase, partial [Myxococcota bacterium]|nr:AAA family ATPase [Myxococcota bacterium]
MTLDLRSLIGRLDATTRRALEGAAGLCLARTHYDVELEHWLVKLVEDTPSDVPRILRHFGVDPERFLRDLNRALDGFKSGNSRRPDLSPTIELLAREGWVQSSINYAQARVRSGAIFLAAISDLRLRRRLVDVHPELRNVNGEVLANELLAIVAGSSEDAEASGAEPGAPARELGPAGAGLASRTPALDQYTVDLTAAARAGKIDPVLGRDAEIRQIVDVLLRRRQNNPILTGEAGVGKTAVVEGFALRIAAKDVPEPLQNVALRTLDLGLLQAGAGVKGEFENRLKQVIEEVQASPVPIILFIDEAHTLIGAGGQQGQNDAANLLKPALARGKLRTIAATTWAEYKKYFEKDAALTRRFQPIKVEEPGEAAAIEMMRGLVAMLEAHHRVRILDEAVVESVRLSSRYIPARQLPDKSVSVLDTACAKVAIGQQAVPAEIEDLRRQLESLERESGILARESATGGDH